MLLVLFLETNVRHVLQLVAANAMMISELIKLHVQESVTLMDVLTVTIQLSVYLVDLTLRLNLINLLVIAQEDFM